jgi:hypothetical protein
MNWILWFFGWIGHVGIWATIFNQLHATAIPKRSRKLSEKAILAIVFLPILFGLASLLPLDQSVKKPLGTQFPFKQLPEPIFEIQTLLLEMSSLSGLEIYSTICVLVGTFFVIRWLLRSLTKTTPAAVISDTANLRNLGQELKRKPGVCAGNKPGSDRSPHLLHGLFAKALGLIPFNQVLMADVKQLKLRLDVPVELDGLRICHLSDLHFTGQIDKCYFQAIVEIANEFQPHLILITGDLLDESRCIPWIEDTLGRLRAEYGCYFVLGNHDLLVDDQATYLAELSRNGLTRVSTWTSVKVNDAVIQLAGNELPWYPGAEQLPPLEEKACHECRLLLTHSPDQFRWARQHGFDLILAGHNHGGQIRFPFIGAVIVPSRFGVKYACGTFQIGRSIMHVSRGISGDEPIRIDCPPEIGLITIHSSRKSAR